MLAISLDNLAHRYGCLPSEALERGTTLDLYVLDVSSRWLQHKQDQENGVTPKEKMPSQQEMLDMLKRARGE